MRLLALLSLLLLAGCYEKKTCCPIDGGCANNVSDTSGSTTGSLNNTNNTSNTANTNSQSQTNGQ